VQQIQKSMAEARAALAQGDRAEAQDALNQVVALDSRRTEAYMLLGDVLQPNDPAAAAIAYRRATAIDATDGVAWEKLAVSFTLGPKPDWPLALQAARSALAVKYDSAALRIAMATAQFGRAALFRSAGRIDSAEDAETEARRHLDIALQLEPDEPQAARLLANQLVAQGRYRDAVRALDKLVPMYPNDLELQTQYAVALSGVGGRDEDAFVAWARIWKLNAKRQVPLKADQYRRVMEGFDLRVANIGKQVAQLINSVATGALPRETAWLQLSRYKEDMAAADAAIKIIQPPVEGRAILTHSARTHAADLMSQALEAHQIYLETGQDIYRVRANELHRNCIIQLNVARTTRG
jgi:tetratricopeptide (TPR) repeat protein